jgi:NarL family two-component system response regulator LiaR
MAESNPIRVLIVDDYDMVRSGLAVFLEAFNDLELVGEAADGAEALRLCAKAHPNVILMDLVMPEVDGVTAIRNIRRAHPEIQIIALTSYSDHKLVVNALQAGAIGYIYKNISIDELANAIRMAKAGKSVLAPEVVRTLIQEPEAPGAFEEGLTPREEEVLALLVEGLTNNEIASQLFISRSTVKTHLSNIFAKLGVNNRVEAVRAALERRLVD